MMAMYGHATPDEIACIKQLEDEVAGGEHPVLLLRLGVLYIEPAHNESAAMKLFDRVLELDPGNIHARLWLAYCCIHYLMDHAALRRAVELSREIEADPETAAAAYMLRAEALRDLGPLSSAENIQLLEGSVERGQDWVNNRERLAWAYEAEGRLEDAVVQVRRALSNLEEFRVMHLPPERRVFEELITGRGQPHLGEELKRHALDLEARLRGPAR